MHDKNGQGEPDIPIGHKKYSFSFQHLLVHSFRRRKIDDASDRVCSNYKIETQEVTFKHKNQSNGIATFKNANACTGVPLSIIYYKLIFFITQLLRKGTLGNKEHSFCEWKYRWTWGNPHLVQMEIRGGNSTNFLPRLEIRLPPRGQGNSSVRVFRSICGWGKGLTKPYQIYMRGPKKKTHNNKGTRGR